MDKAGRHARLLPYACLYMARIGCYMISQGSMAGYDGAEQPRYPFSSIGITLSNDLSRLQHKVKATVYATCKRSRAMSQEV